MEVIAKVLLPSREALIMSKTMTVTIDHGLSSEWQATERMDMVLPSDHLVTPLTEAAAIASITVSSLIIPERKTTEGILVRSTSAIWSEIVQKLGSDWNLAFQLTPDQWEELIAGAFHKEGYEVTKTPRSGDHGRDIIAIKDGIGTVKILGSVKAYKPDHLVEYDAVRALVGVVTADQKASKGIITTTSDFPPLMEKDPSIAPFLPTRLELVDGKRLQQWLNELSDKSRNV